MNSKHHELSPSKYNAWAKCVQYIPANRQSEESGEGSHIHEELEKGLKNQNYDPDNPTSRWARDTLLALHEGCTDELSSEMELCGTIEGVEGIYGTADALWTNGETIHVADLKSFSDGTEDYIPQLMGYVALFLTNGLAGMYHTAVLHVLHGGIKQVETVEYDTMDCLGNTLELLKKVKAKSDSDTASYHTNKYCQYCSKIKECPAANHALDVACNSLAFEKLSMPQKLVVLDTVDKLSKTIREEAKQLAIANGGAIEQDGIRYEIKERAGKSSVRDLCELSGALGAPYIDDKKGNPVLAKGIPNEKLLDLCELPKSAFINAMKEANDGNGIPKKNIEAWCASFYEKGEPIKVFVRTK